MKTWRVIAELYWSANTIAQVEIKANTERKARKLAKEKLQKQYKSVGNMINILSCDLLEPYEPCIVRDI